MKPDTCTFADRPRHPFDAAARISIHENNYDFKRLLLLIQRVQRRVNPNRDDEEAKNLNCEGKKRTAEIMGQFYQILGDPIDHRSNFDTIAFGPFKYPHKHWGFYGGAGGNRTKNDVESAEVVDSTKRIR